MRSAPVVVVASLALLVLTSCQPDEGPVIPDPSPTTTPIFASDEEALAAAEEAYREYQEAEDLISSEGGVQPERIREFATGEALEAAYTGFSNYERLGYRSVGVTRFAVMALQQYSPEVWEGVGIVSAYLCLELTDLDVVDSEGVSVVSATRPDFQAFEISFDYVGDQLLLATRDPWTGGGVCGE